MALRTQTEKKKKTKAIQKHKQSKNKQVRGNQTIFHLLPHPVVNQRVRLRVLCQGGGGGSGVSGYCPDQCETPFFYYLITQIILKTVSSTGRVGSSVLLIRWVDERAFMSGSPCVRWCVRIVSCKCLSVCLCVWLLSSPCVCVSAYLQLCFPRVCPYLKTSFFPDSRRLLTSLHPPSLLPTFLLYLILKLNAACMRVFPRLSSSLGLERLEQENIQKPLLIQFSHLF